MEFHWPPSGGGPASVSREPCPLAAGGGLPVVERGNLALHTAVAGALVVGGAAHLRMYAPPRRPTRDLRFASVLIPRSDRDKKKSGGQIYLVDLTTARPFFLCDRVFLLSAGQNKFCRRPRPETLDKRNRSVGSRRPPKPA